MTNLDKLIKKVQAAQAEALKIPPVRLSTKFRHYTTTKTRAEQAVQNINKINRNAPVKVTKIKRKRRK